MLHWKAFLREEAFHDMVDYKLKRYLQMSKQAVRILDELKRTHEKNKGNDDSLGSGDLARLIGIEQSNVIPLLRRLQSHGAIIDKTDAKRGARFVISEKGMKHLAQVSGKERPKTKGKQK